MWLARHSGKNNHVGLEPNPADGSRGRRMSDRDLVFLALLYAFVAPLFVAQAIILRSVRQDRTAIWSYFRAIFLSIPPIGLYSQSAAHSFISIPLVHFI